MGGGRVLGHPLGGDAVKKVLGAIGSLVGFVVLLAAIAVYLVFTSPREHKVVGSVIIAETQADVFEEITNLDTRKE